MATELSNQRKAWSVLIVSTLAFTVCFMVWMMFAVIGIPLRKTLGLNATEFGLSPGEPLRVIATPLGRIGVLICYDAEFPLLARALVAAGAEILLVPSWTEAEEGYNRVRIGAMARALEGQCIAVQAPTQGAAPWSWFADENAGAAGIFAPPDTGFPPTGVIAEGGMNAPGWVIAEVDLAALATVRAAGNVRTRADWAESPGRAGQVQTVTLA